MLFWILTGSCDKSQLPGTGETRFFNQLEAQRSFFDVILTTHQELIEKNRVSGASISYPLSGYFF